MCEGKQDGNYNKRSESSKSRQGRDAGLQEASGFAQNSSARRCCLFHISQSVGQIILDPQASIPACELWVFENKDILASIDRGIRESLNGKTINRGSFAEHVNDAP